MQSRILILCSALVLVFSDPTWSQESRLAPTAELLQRTWSHGGSAEKGPIKLSSFPLRLEDIGTIVPMGLTASGHVTPSDHLYLIPKESTDQGKQYDVVAVADGCVVNIQWRPKGNPDPTVQDREVDLKVIVEHSPTCWSHVDHLTQLDPALTKQIDPPIKPGQPALVRIPVKAGQTVGKIGFQTFDFALVDITTTRKGFVVPDRFLKRDPWKLHTVDRFDYVNEPLKSQLLELNPRKAAPRGGRMDYDIDGRLVGNWYQEGTGDYAGANQRLDYWIGHLAFVYHHINPKNIVVSIGNYHGTPRQFWVKGNGPDPATISQPDGVVKYELMWGRLGASGQQQIREDADVVQGILLAQVLPDRKLKCENFPNKTAADVHEFTTAATTYGR